MALTTGALLAIAGGSLATGALASGGAAWGASSKIKKAREEEAESYKKAQNFLDSQYYRDPLSTVGNKALLKSMDERMRDQADAMENRAAAGGATMENQLAARQASNQTMSNVYTQLLQGEDARRDALNAQKMQLDMQHSANVQNSFYQDAQAWQNWGSTMGNAFGQLGSAALLGIK